MPSGTDYHLVGKQKLDQKFAASCTKDYTVHGKIIHKWMLCQDAHFLSLKSKPFSLYVQVTQSGFYVKKLFKAF